MAFDGYNAGSGNWLASSSTLAHGIGTGGFTFAAWVYPTAIGSGTLRSIWSNGALASSLTFLLTSGATAKITAYFTDGAYPFDTTLSINTLAHVALRRNGTTISAFVNGVQEATTWSAFALSTGSIVTATQYIGGADSSSYAGRANISEAALWAAALSNDEIKALANRRKPPDVRLAGLRAYWPLNRETNDRWSAGLTMNAQNGTATYVDHVPLIEEFGQFVSLTASGGGGGATAGYVIGSGVSSGAILGI